MCVDGKRCHGTCRCNYIKCRCCCFSPGRCLEKKTRPFLGLFFVGRSRSSRGTRRFGYVSYEVGKEPLFFGRRHNLETRIARNKTFIGARTYCWNRGSEQANNSVRVDEGRNSWNLLAIKRKGTYRSREGEEEPLYWPLI